jgi:hypothetical protein
VDVDRCSEEVDPVIARGFIPVERGVPAVSVEDVLEGSGCPRI